MDLQRNDLKKGPPSSNYGTGKILVEKNPVLSLQSEIRVTPAPEYPATTARSDDTPTSGE